VITVENRKQRRNEVLDCMKYAIGLYQFLYDRYFEIENEKLKKQMKKQDIQPSDDQFMNAMESALLGISEEPDAPNILFEN
jgi:phage terminase large subunit GpA-like protein